MLDAYQVADSIRQGNNMQRNGTSQCFAGEVHKHIPVPMLHHHFPWVRAGARVSGITFTHGHKSEISQQLVSAHTGDIIGKFDRTSGRFACFILADAVLLRIRHIKYIIIIHFIITDFFIRCTSGFHERAPRRYNYS